MILQIEVNTDCNFSCWYCPNSRHRKKPARHMSLSLFKKILESFKEYDSKNDIVSFADYNEPTLDPLFHERLLLLTSMNLRYWYISNASNTTVKTLNFLRDKNIKIYAMHLNVPSVFEEELAYLTNISLDEAKTTLENLKEIADFAPTLNFPVSLAIHSEDSEKIHEFEKFVKGKITISHVGVMNRAGHLSNIPGPNHGTYHISCSINNPNNIYVSVDGRLYLCCNDYYKNTVYGDATNIKDSVLSIERESQLVELKKQLCTNCVYAIPIKK